MEKTFSSLIIISLVLFPCYCNKPKRSFTVDYYNHVFMKDNISFQYVSGSIHYFRIPEEYWHDRLSKMKAAGLDAIQIYIPWNFHQPEKGVYDFDGDRNLEKFLELATSLDLLVIARVGPYICAEWDFGGLPVWLLRINPLMKLRSSDPEYMKFVTTWFNVLLPSMKRFLYENGGPIIMVQLENEYGSYSTCDETYLKELYNLARLHLGENVIIFTSDGPSNGLLKCGSSDKRYLATVNFGPTTAPVPKVFKVLEDFRQNQPWVNSEYYVGWLDVWGGDHHKTNPEWAVDGLNRLISYSMRVNVNMYMFQGGTNFGFWNGGARPESSITSYDYDAPISEAGDITRKYMIIRDLLFRRKGTEPPKLPRNTTKISYGCVNMKFKSHLLENKAPVTRSEFPLIMESLRQYNGFMIYSVTVTVPRNGSIFLKFFGISDIAHVYTGDKSGHYTFHGSIRYVNKTFQLNNVHDVNNITIIAENAGHINYGSEMYSDVKGITGPVILNGKELRDWTMIPIRDPFAIVNMNKMKHFLSEKKWPVPGSIYHGVFIVEELGDTFIQPDSFVRGIISINRHHVGRFDQQQGPQLRLYVPKTFLKLGRNHITITELQGPIKNDAHHVHITFHDQMLWK